MSSNTVTLWTRQVPEVWEELQTSGIYRVKEEYIHKKNGSIADYYISLYRWYTHEARKYIEIPDYLEYPIWMCLSEETMLQPTDNTVILKLEIPEEKVVMCNMEAWGYVVNYWYVPLNAVDERRHVEELERYGIKEEDELISTSKGNFYPMLKQKIKDSWGRVFTMPPANNNNAVATVWEIKKEWVKEVRQYSCTQNKEHFLTEDGCVIMWSAQNQSVIDTILCDGVSYVKKEYIRKKYGEVAWIFETAYDFFIGQFSSYVKRPKLAESPVWLFRDPVWTGGGADVKLLKLKIPASELVLFDRKMWEKVLNLSYIGDEKEQIVYKNELSRRGLKEESDVFLKSQYPMLKEKVMNSWSKIFDIDTTEERNVQGAVWCIKREWIV